MSNPDSGANAPNGSGDALHAFSDALANAVDTLAPSIVAVHARRRIPASGVVWRAGYVVVTDHTIRRETDITVTLHDGRQVAATLVARDASTDLALLKLADDSVPVAPRTSANSTRPGSIVLAVLAPPSPPHWALSIPLVANGARGKVVRCRSPFAWTCRCTTDFPAAHSWTLVVT